MALDSCIPAASLKLKVYFLINNNLYTLIPLLNVVSGLAHEIICIL